MSNEKVQKGIFNVSVPPILALDFRHRRDVAGSERPRRTDSEDQENKDPEGKAQRGGKRRHCDYDAIVVGVDQCLSLPLFAVMMGETAFKRFEGGVGQVSVALIMVGDDISIGI